MRILLGFCLIACLFFQSCDQKSSDKLEMDPTFVHVVYFWLNDPASDSERKEFEAALNTLLEASEFAQTNYVGIPPKATREVVDDTFSYCLILTFDSAEAQENYQTEPAHLTFIENASHLWNKVVVYDALGQD
ncbi:MAG: Dabb family protein [Flavobacteriaceae bacterium]|nr:Dabb family protein [Flavobacteriaceae bacterium]